MKKISINKWFRKLHRFLAVPFLLLLVTILFTRGTSLGDTTQRIQQIFMLFFAITGAYLFALPYWSKWKRRNTRNAE